EKIFEDDGKGCKNIMKDTLKMGVRLLIICAVAGLCLALTYSKTKPKIDEQEKLAEQEAYSSLFADAASFDEVDKGTPAEEVSKIVCAKDSQGNTLGYCVSVAPNGYKGAINMNVGVKADGTLSGVRIGSNSETAGLGARVSEESFYGQYEGKTTPIVLGDQVQAITGATISSTAVTTGVNAAAEAVAPLLGK
ncbi:MAG: FMN-binding protein, partial [Christensenellales bacterium]